MMVLGRRWAVAPFVSLTLLSHHASRPDDSRASWAPRDIHSMCLPDPLPMTPTPFPPPLPPHSPLQTRNIQAGIDFAGKA